MGTLEQLDGCPVLECFQYQHLFLIVPRYFSSNPVFVLFPVKYISVSIFQRHLNGVGISQQPFSSNGGKQHLPELGYSPLSLPCGGVCLTNLMVEDGRARRGSVSRVVI